MTNILKANIWGRSFSLPIVYDCYEGETITRAQIDAVESFASHLDWIDRAKKQVETYCQERVSADDKNLKKDNIFSYIMPESFFVKREKDHPRVALMCQYRYDPEHGLAIVFSKDGHVDIGSQDIVL